MSVGYLVCGSRTAQMVACPQTTFLCPGFTATFHHINHNILSISYHYLSQRVSELEPVASMKSCMALPCSHALPTPLEELARQTQTCQRVDASDVLFPMYTVQSHVLLEMKEVRPHEDLLAQGLLTKFHHTMGHAAFVSHQWVESSHPDPRGQQLKILQDAIRNVASGKIQVVVARLNAASFDSNHPRLSSFRWLLKIPQSLGDFFSP